jgi:hypothetical protein
MMQRAIRPALLVLTLSALAGPAHADEVRKLATEPRRTQEIGPPGAPARLDFFFGDIRAWLLQNGDWHIEGNVKHHGILCAKYELGIQFGIGNPGCANVEWIGMPAYVTEHTQCNGALLHHSGTDIDPVAAEDFEKITCAQRLIRCTGNCK